MLLGQSGLSLERLQTLCTIADSGSIAAAAGGDANRQSQFSRQIGELEKFFGVELLNRETRPYRLNQQGLDLVRLTLNYEQELADFHNRCTNRPQSLKIGSGDSSIQWLLVPDLARWQKHLPDVSIHFDTMRTMETVQQLKDGEIDIGLIRKNAIAGSPLKCTGSLKFSYRLFIPDALVSKPLPAKVNFKQIADLPLAVIDGAGEFRTRIAELASDAKVNLKIMLEVPSLTLVASAINNGNSAGFLPEFTSTIIGEGVTMHKVDGFAHLDRELTFAWNPARVKSRPVLEKAISFLKTTF